LKAKHHTVRYENPQLSAQGKAKLNEEDVLSSPGWEKPIEKPVEKTTSALRKKQYRNTFKLEGCVFTVSSEGPLLSESVIQEYRNTP
jgi:hypothetical protein